MTAYEIISIFIGILALLFSLNSEHPPLEWVLSVYINITTIWLTIQVVKNDYIWICCFSYIDYKLYRSLNIGIHS